MKRKNKIILSCGLGIFIMACIASLFYFSGLCKSIFNVSQSLQGVISKNNNNGAQESEEKTEEAKSESGKDTQEVKSEEEIIDEKAEEILDRMTLEEKAGQLFIVELDSLNGGETCTQI